ncbi:MAG: hypothetical protein WBA77_16720 [Microcoleaceae cyanobacterium]
MSLPESQSKPTQQPSDFESVTELNPPATVSSDWTQSKFKLSLAIATGIALTISFLLFGVGASFSIVVGVPSAIVAVVLSYQYPRTALWLLLLYLPFAGTVSYWLGNDHPLFHFAKDVFYFPALIALLIQLKQQRSPIIVLPQLKIPLMFLFAIALGTLLFVNGSQQLSSNPNGQPLIMGIFGFKVLMGYIPLIVCGYTLIDNPQDLHRFTRLQLTLAIICCVLGLIQYGLVVTGVCLDNTGLPDHLLLRANLQRKCLVGGALGYFPDKNFIRLPGTFVAPWQWSWFLISNTFFSFATALNDSKKRWQSLGYLSLSLLFINAILCGQRTAMVAVPLIVILLLIASRHIAAWKRLLIIGLAGLIVLGGSALIFPDLATDRFESLVSRWNASPPQEFITEQAGWTSEKHEGFWGNGLGRATNAARALGEARLVEAYYPKLLYEIGPVGVIAFLSVVTTLTIYGFKSYRQLKDYRLWGYGIAFWLFIVIISYNSYWYPLDTDPVAVYYWFVAGLLLKLPQLQKQRRGRDSNPRQSHP